MLCKDEAQEWLCMMERSDAATCTPAQRVAAVIKTKLGCFEHTKVAIQRRAPSRAWGKVPQHMREQLLQCQCGQGQQDAYHLWHECSHSQRVMVEVCASIEQRWPEMMQLPGWTMCNARERVRRILSLKEWADSPHQRVLKGRCASIVVGAMQMHGAELELHNLGLRRQILTHAALAGDSPL